LRSEDCVESARREIASGACPLLKVAEERFGFRVRECPDSLEVLQGGLDKPGIERVKVLCHLNCKELRNGLIIRELPGLLRELGFSHIRITPEVEVAQELDAFYTWFVEPSLKHFKGIGAFSDDEAEALLSDLQERARRGRYFSSRTFYTILALQSS
jgi:hypothetical protein